MHDDEDDDVTGSARDFLPEKLSLSTLRTAAAGCHGCSLYRNATQTVFGAGPSRARLILVGEQPGNDEDIAGEIAGRFQHTWATTTGHIRILESAQLLNQKKIGRVRHYTINEKRLSVLQEWLSWFKKDSAEAAEFEREPARKSHLR